MSYRNLPFSRAPISSILGFRIRTYTKKEVSVGEGRVSDLGSGFRVQSFGFSAQGSFHSKRRFIGFCFVHSRTSDFRFQKGVHRVLLSSLRGGGGAAGPGLWDFGGFVLVGFVLKPGPGHVVLTRTSPKGPHLKPKPPSKNPKPPLTLNPTPSNMNHKP